MTAAVVLYAFGSNACGQLGIGDTEDTSIPQPSQVLDGYEWPAPIAMIKGGGSHTLVLLKSGALYASGSLGNGRTGLNNSEVSISRFHQVPSAVFGGSKVKLCSALWEASVVVTEDDEVYTFGLGPKGELGVGQAASGNSHRLGRFWPPEEEIIDVASGMSHTIVVASNGDVYGWGNGRKGQLGEPAEVVWRPRKIAGSGFKVVRAACGTEFSYLVGDTEEGSHVILGSDKWNVRSNAPAAIPGWQKVDASWGSIYVISGSGELHTWGRNDHGQLGPARHPENFKDIAAGSEHTLALTLSNNVASWGWGEHGNCGPGIDAQGDVKGWYNALQPDRFGKASGVVGVAAGCATSFVWTQPTND